MNVNAKLKLQHFGFDGFVDQKFITFIFEMNKFVKPQHGVKMAAISLLSANNYK